MIRLVLSLKQRSDRHSDFLLGLPMSELPSMDNDVRSMRISPADRLRLVYDYVTSLSSEGGLGITPGGKDWRRVQSVMALHDHAFNDLWIRAWTRRQVGFAINTMELDRLRDHASIR